MKKYIFCFIFLALISCSRKSYHGINKYDWKISFKDQVFIHSLRYLYGKDFNKILIDQDMSASNNFEHLYRTHDSLANITGKKFSNSINNLPDGYLIEGKRTILNFCLEYYNSKRLESIADSIFNADIRKKKRTNHY